MATSTNAIPLPKKFTTKIAETPTLKKTVGLL